MTKDRHTLRRGALALVLALAAATPALAAPPGSPPTAERLSPTRLRPPLVADRASRARALIALADRPAARAAQDPLRRRALAGRLSSAELAALRHGPASPRISRRHERSRERALDELQGAVRAAERSQVALLRAVVAAGGDVLERDPLANTVTANVPVRALPALAGRSEVAAIERAPEPRLLGLETSSAAVGAPTFWAAGHTGGRGPRDVPSPDGKGSTDLAVLSDKIQEDHPAFAGIPFQRPEGTPENLYDDCPPYRSSGGCDHGTRVASMAISRGATGCSLCVPADADKRGVAPGLDTVLDADTRRRLSDGSYQSVDDGLWALGITQRVPYPYDLTVPGASDPADAMTYSSGGHPTRDDSLQLQGTDELVARLGTPLSTPSGNDGLPSSVNDPCIAYNTLCTGAFLMGETAGPTDDVMADFSSRGPTLGGRKKPDLVAVGRSEVANRAWADPDPSSGGLWTSDSGTSFSTPQVGAGASLLSATGISDPIAQKAILLNSARQGRAAPALPMGTQSGWQPDWGWGALDLESALRERPNFHTQGVPGEGVRFYRSGTQAAGDRATLVWHRRVTGCAPSGCRASPLTNLDLFELDPATGAERRRSDSTIDNVEQVSTPAPGPVVYKIKARSSVDGLPAEPFALAATRQVTPLVNPQPTAQLALGHREAPPGQGVTAELRVRNPSPDLSAEGAQATLELPPGVELTPGSGPAVQRLGTLAPSGEATARWSVRGTNSGLHELAARVSAQRYGESFSARDAQALLVSGTAPSSSTTARGSAALRLTRAVVRGSTLSVRGTIAPQATGSVIAAYSARRGSRPLRVSRAAPATRGRFAVRLRLSRRLRSARRGRLTVRYGGDARHGPATVSRTLRRR